MAKSVLTLDDAVEKIIELTRQTPIPRPLPFYWDVGELLSRVPDEYGSKKRKSIADKLIAAKIEGVGAINLFKASNFYKKIERSDAAKLEQRGVGWRAADQLCSSHVDWKRDKLIDAVLTGKVEPNKFGAMIRQTAGQKALTNHRSITTAVARATKDIKLLIRLAYSSRTDNEFKNAALIALQKLQKLLNEPLA